MFEKDTTKATQQALNLRSPKESNFVVDLPELLMDILHQLPQHFNSQTAKDFKSYNEASIDHTICYIAELIASKEEDNTTLIQAVDSWLARFFEWAESNLPSSRMQQAFGKSPTEFKKWQRDLTALIYKD